MSFHRSMTQLAIRVTILAAEAAETARLARCYHRMMREPIANVADGARSAELQRRACQQYADVRQAVGLVAEDYACA